MSIITKRGDSGQTDLMYGRRVSKNHPRVVANGAIDELNSALGLVRWQARDEELEPLNRQLAQLQAQLVLLMGEVATMEEDHDRYRQDGFQIVAESTVDRLTGQAKEIEAELNARFKNWAIPGATDSLLAVYLDQARTICRRAERSVLVVTPDAVESPRTAVFLNRLSDYLWLLARAVEREAEITDCLKASFD